MTLALTTQLLEATGQAYTTNYHSVIPVWRDHPVDMPFILVGLKTDLCSDPSIKPGENFFPLTILFSLIDTNFVLIEALVTEEEAQALAKEVLSPPLAKTQL